jgi:hypothetical protein
MDPLSLDAVALRTCQPVRRLREWCATGRLPCQGTPEGWFIERRDIARVFDLAADHERRATDVRHGILAVPANKGVEDLQLAVSQGTGIQRSDIAVNRMVIDGEDHVVATWSHPADSTTDLLALASELGGELLIDGEAG